MAEVKKIATRESYGNALVELGQPLQLKQECLKKLFQKDILTVVSQSAI